VREKVFCAKESHRSSFRLPGGIVSTKYLPRFFHRPDECYEDAFAFGGEGYFTGFGDDGYTYVSVADGGQHPDGFSLQKLLVIVGPDSE